MLSSLERIVEKANKLREFKFDEHVKKVGLKLEITRSDTDDWILDFGIPDVKQMAAFVLTLRMFVQDNESIGFPNIHGLLREKDLTDNLRDGIKSVRKDYFDYLNGYSDYTVELFEGHSTRGDILRTVLYGDLAHGNDPKTMEKFRSWTQDDILANLLKQEFTSILLQILVFINFLADMSKKELQSKAS